MLNSALLPTASRRAISHWWSLPVLMAGTVMIVLDFFIVNVALPSMQAGLHASAAIDEWVVAGYGLTFAVLMVLAGRLGDQFGRRRVFVWGLVLFGATSAMCGLAPDPATLVAGRFLQGAAAALISPSVLALIGVIFTGPERVKAISVYGVTMGLAAACGQLLGGLLIQADIAGLGWRPIFLVNLPIAALASVLAGRLVPESRAAATTRLDTRGLILVTSGLLALVLPLIQGRQEGWPAWTWVSLAAAPILLGAFALHQRQLERSGGSPVMSPALFSISSLRWGLITQLCFWCGQAALFLVLALYLQDGRGLDPLKSGLVFTILAVAYLATSLPAPRWTVRFGREVIAVGAIMLAVGEASLAGVVALNGSRGALGALVPGLLLAGAGMGLCITPLTTVILAHCDPERAGAVSGAMSTMQQVGNAVGVAITGLVYFGSLHSGTAKAFEVSAVQLAGLLAAVAVLTRWLPAQPRSV